MAGPEDCGDVTQKHPCEGCECWLGEEAEFGCQCSVDDGHYPDDCIRYEVEPLEHPDNL